MKKKYYPPRKTKDAPPLTPIYQDWRKLLQEVYRTGIRKATIARAVGISVYRLDSLLDSGVVHRGRDCIITWESGQLLIQLHQIVTSQLGNEGKV